MTATSPGLRTETATTSRWVDWITWVAILSPLPYGLSRLLWAAGVPVGISEPLLDDLEAPGWGSVYIAALALLTEGTAVFTGTFVRSRARRVPDWIPVLRRRRVRPWMVIAPLLLPISILGLASVEFLGVMLDGFRIPADLHGLPGWSFWGQVAVFMTWGVSLTVATFLYWRDTRAWAD